MYKTTTQLRDAFLEFFASKGHKIVPSSSLVPTNDPTLLFTNAGMNQFKDVFLGVEKLPFSRATTSQRCVRAGGKHNDLDNVGFTARHHTFFEMLGNFSFGDYFKQDAIQFAWEFLTEVLKLPKEKLWITVFEEDDEAAEIWIKKIGVDPNRVSRIGAKDNFWQMGDTGPCGPCSEIFYDHGEHIWGGPPGTPEEDGDRFIEIWNLVFMQFNRQQDGTLDPLPKPSVDTGMGLERISAILQNVHSNYEIDLFQTLIKEIANIIGVSDLSDRSLRVIADHIRSCAFLVADGINPSNEGRGYVLRRIIRRAVRHGNKLGAKTSFFYKLVPTLVTAMGNAASELSSMQDKVMDVLKQEEEQFAKTLERGMSILTQALDPLLATDNLVLDGATIFKLYDTYGFPVDLTADVCRTYSDKEITLDIDGFDLAMSKQREMAQAAGQFTTDYNKLLAVDINNTFVGYEQLKADSTIDAIYVESNKVDEIKEGTKAILFLKETPFYAESGGQIGDQGTIYSSGAKFKVLDTQKFGSALGSIGVLESGSLKINEKVNAEVIDYKRSAIAANHTATHLLHAALRKILGDHVQQKGSLVDAKKLRFDFAQNQSVTKEQLLAIENLVNEKIIENIELQTNIMAIENAKAAGAMALFGEKYADDVRVVSMDDFSLELCGGTHAKRTGDIGIFKIISEAGIAAGVRRIEAVTGIQALELTQAREKEIATICNLLKTDSNSLIVKVTQHLDRSKELERKLSQLEDKIAASASQDLIKDVQQIDGISVLIKKLTVEPKALLGLNDELKQKITSGVIVLATVSEGKVQILVGVSKDLISKIHAGALIKNIAQMVGGKGGGRPDLAQAGGTNPQNLDEALSKTVCWIKEMIN